VRIAAVAIGLFLVPASAISEEVPAEVQSPVEEPSAPTTAGPATLLPNISVIGNFVGRAASKDIDEKDKSYLALQEAEVVFQSAVYPSIRADFVIALEDTENHRAALEEGYATATQIGQTRLSARLGRLRTPFGKLNSQHPHQWPFVNQPAVNTALVSEHGQMGQGVAVDWLLPFRRLFTQIELGQWQAATHSGDAEPSDAAQERSAFDEDFTTARLWTSIAPTEASELEFGLSAARGDGLVAANERGRVTLAGADVTFRRWPATFARDILRLEWVSHRAESVGGSRTGFYLLAARQPSRYWEYGLRFDRTEVLFPLEGRWTDAAAFVTRRLNETTYLRVQIEQGKKPDVGNYTAAYFQMLFGMGPHRHTIE